MITPAADVGRIARNDTIFARLENRVRGKREIDVARNPVSADVLEIRIGVMDFDELEHVAPRIRRRIIHDLGNGNGRAAAGGARRFS